MFVAPGMKRSGICFGFFFRGFSGQVPFWDFQFQTGMGILSFPHVQTAPGDRSQRAFHGERHPKSPHFPSEGFFGMRGVDPTFPGAAGILGNAFPPCPGTKPWRSIPEDILELCHLPWGDTGAVAGQGSFQRLGILAGSSRGSRNLLWDPMGS